MAVRLHAGWAYDADTSDLAVSSLLSWDGGKLSITSVAPTVSPAANDEEWIQSRLHADAWDRVEPPWTEAPAVELAGPDERLVVVRGARLDLHVRWLTRGPRQGTWPFRGLELPRRAAPTLEEAEASIAGLAVGAGGRDLEYLARRLPPGARRSALLVEAGRRQVEENILGEPVSDDQPALAWAFARRGKGLAAVNSGGDSVGAAATRLAAMRLHDDLVVLSQAPDERKIIVWRALAWCLSAWFAAALVKGETAEALTAAECLVAVTEALRQLENTPAAVGNAVEARLRAAVAAYQFGGGDGLERTASLLEAARSDLRSFPATHPQVGHARLLESYLLTNRKQLRPALAALERARLAADEDPILAPQIEAQELVVRVLLGEVPPPPQSDTTDPDVLIQQAFALWAGGAPAAAVERAALGLPTVLRDMAGITLVRTLYLGAQLLRETDPSLASMLLWVAEGALELRAMSADSEDQRLAIEADPLATAVRDASVDILFTSGVVDRGVALLDSTRAANLRSRLTPVRAGPPLQPVEHVEAPPLSGPPSEQFRIAGTFALERIGGLLSTDGGQPFMDPSGIQQLVDDVGQQILVVHPVGDRVA
ncbi:MAG: hypothetical protein M3450_20190, partial [Actinomycetota bacterium]|nr:hypothetical protein [Actinomycetota bacterium]